MTLQLLLQKDAEAVNGYLDGVLNANQLEADGVPERLVAAMRHAVLGAGKRFRPFIVLSSCRLFDVPDRVSVPVAAAIELVHCYSLVHDDLPAMDNDVLRRGVATVWSAYDEWTAILVGDALLSLSFGILAGSDLRVSDGTRTQLVASLAKASGPAGMVGGQQYDLDVSKRRLPATPSAAFVERLQVLKTGALLACAAEAGAITGGGDDAQRHQLRRYGETIGLAFQIADDLMDVEGNVDKTGKAVGKDAAAGKATVIGVCGIDGARRRLRALEAEAIDALAAFDERAAPLREAAHFAVSHRS